MPAYAESFKAKPATWRLEKYDSTGVIYSHTPSKCADGKIEFSPSTPLSESNRFFAAVMSSKKLSKPMSVSYSMNGTACFIDSFSTE